MKKTELVRALLRDIDERGDGDVYLYAGFKDAEPTVLASVERAEEPGGLVLTDIEASGAAACES